MTYLTDYFIALIAPRTGIEDNLTSLRYQVDKKSVY
jgi:hypothetical protein